MCIIGPFCVSRESHSFCPSFSPWTSHLWEFRPVCIGKPVNIFQCNFWSLFFWLTVFYISYFIVQFPLFAVCSTLEWMLTSSSWRRRWSCWMIWRKRFRCWILPSLIWVQSSSRDLQHRQSSESQDLQLSTFSTLSPLQVIFSHSFK